MMFKSVVNLVLISVALAWYPPDGLMSNIYSGDYPNDYDPDHQSDPERVTFDGIYERRKGFDVETPMEFPAESKPEGEELNDYQLHASDPNDYNLYTNNNDNSNQNQSPYSNPNRYSNQNQYSNPNPNSNPNQYSNQNPYSNPNQDSNSNPTDDYASESITDSNGKQTVLTDGCLRCLCEASSECDPQVRCHVEGPTAYNCGPFQINLNYWTDAGSPGADQNDPLDFEECMNDIECSIDTVNSYMKKHSKDCDGDGRVSCDDYAKIHKAGYNQCNSSWILNTPYWTKYKDCFFEYR